MPAGAHRLGAVRTCLLVILTGAGQTACLDIVHVPYPAQWAEVPAAQDICRDLEGSYTSAGEKALVGNSDQPDIEPDPPSLATLLLGEDTPADYVTIQHTGNGAFRFEAHLLGTAPVNRTTQATCGDSTLTVPAPDSRGAFNDWVAFGYEYHTVELARAADGSLAVRSGRGGYGLAMLFPAANSTSYWFRYLPVNPLLLKRAGATTSGD